MSENAVVLMAYGSPERLEDVPAYYADIRGGRPIRPELMDDLVARYRALGIDDGSPLNAITEETRAALERELGLPVFTGMRHWQPRIAEAAERAVEAGATTVVGLVLAPHYSSMSIERYREQLVDALAERAELRFVRSWGEEDGFVALLSQRVTMLTQGHRDRHVVFTAHSLPARIVAEGDPYADELLRTSELVAAAAGWSTGASRSKASRRPVSRGSGRTSSTTSPTSTARASATSSSARSASSPTTSRSDGISTPRRSSAPRSSA